MAYDEYLLANIEYTKLQIARKMHEIDIIKNAIECQKNFKESLEWDLSFNESYRQEASLSLFNRSLLTVSLFLVPMLSAYMVVMTTRIMETHIRINSISTISIDLISDIIADIIVYIIWLILLYYVTNKIVNNSTSLFNDPKLKERREEILKIIQDTGNKIDDLYKKLETLNVELDKLYEKLGEDMKILRDNIPVYSIVNPYY